VKVKVEFMIPYKEHIESPVIIGLEKESDLGMLVKKLSEEYPVMKRSFESEIDRPTVSVNGQIVFKMETTLADGDEIIIFPPVGGG